MQRSERPSFFRIPRVAAWLTLAVAATVWVASPMPGEITDAGSQGQTIVLFSSGEW